MWVISLVSGDAPVVGVEPISLVSGDAPVVGVEPKGTPKGTPEMSKSLK
jgi:hypothetical protein